MSDWDGYERRSNKDHDLLTRIDEKLGSLMDKVIIHLEDDKKAFKEITDKLQWGGGIVFMGLGAIALLKLFIN